MINENKIKLISSMMDVVLQNVHHYRSDFTEYDIPAILKREKGELCGLWFVRDCGTNLLWYSLYKDDKRLYQDLVSTYMQYNDKVYCIYEDGTLTETNFQVLEEWLSLEEPSKF